MSTRLTIGRATLLAVAIGGAAIWFGLAKAKAKAAEQPPAGRSWAIERCHADKCDLLGWRYSSPTACNVDIKSERIGKQMPAGVRLVCVKEKGETR